MIDWIKNNWFNIIIFIMGLGVLIVFTLLLQYGCSQGWYDCTMTNSTAL